jgi:integrase
MSGKSRSSKKDHLAERLLVKIGRVEVSIRQYADGRWGFDDYSSGQRIRVRCRTKRKAEARATDAAVLTANGRNEFSRFDQVKWQRFLKWEEDRNTFNATLGEVIAEFVALKKVKSTDTHQSLKDNLKLFEQFIGARTPIISIKALDIQRFIDSRNAGQRRQFNLRAIVISLFRWARRMSYLPDEQMTAAEKVEPVELKPGDASVLSPSQMQILIANVKEKFLPWLLIGGFSGIRSGEIAPTPQSKKSPLKWEDFDWKHRVIIVRRETAKTKEEREVPILPNLAQWLAPWRHAKGPVIKCKVLPSRRETARLGKLIGGWKTNYLRDSYCSYRSRITQNVPQVSYEMGNSIAMVKRSYHRRQPIRAAKEWFKIRPVRDSKVIAFKQTA